MVFLASHSDACFITNCPPAGKRSLMPALASSQFHKEVCCFAFLKISFFDNHHYSSALDAVQLCLVDASALVSAARQ